MACRSKERVIYAIISARAARRGRRIYMQH